MGLVAWIKTDDDDDDDYEILPATLVNTFLFILQGSALADLMYGGRF